MSSNTITNNSVIWWHYFY